jgi:hypothetical protein
MIRVLLIAGALTVEFSAASWRLELAARTFSGALMINLASKVYPITWVKTAATRSAQDRC